MEPCGEPLVASGSQDLNEICDNKVTICDIKNCAKSDKLCITVPEILERKFFWVSDTMAMDNVSEQAHSGALWFPSELVCFAEKGFGCFLDLGANIGGVSLALEACGWKGFAVEASEINCNLFKKSIFLNDADITLCQMGIWKSTRSVYFLQNGPWGTILEDGENWENAVTIDAFCLNDYEKTDLSSIRNLDLIKMDIEGSEVAALEGMGDFLKKMDYPFIFAEANALALSNTAGNTVGDMIRKSAEYGYGVYRFMDGVWRKFNESYFIDCICTDYMFIHKDKIASFPGQIGDPCLQPDSNKTITSILNVLNQVLSSLSNKESLESAVAILATLRDFPLFAQDERVMDLLLKIDKNPELPQMLKKPLKKLLS